jgi:hypothetical protein
MPTDDIIPNASRGGVLPDTGADGTPANHQAAVASIARKHRRIERIERI